VPRVDIDGSRRHAVERKRAAADDGDRRRTAGPGR
jgi:hypothetical protein